MEQVRHGLISKDDEAVQLGQNILTRSLGTDTEVKVDLDEHPLFPDDVVLLCSDGLNKEMNDNAILRTVMQYAEPKQIAERLIKMANDSGGRDNITVAVARIEKAPWGERLSQLFKR
jgi:PPM family protein phosphatase